MWHHLNIITQRKTMTHTNTPIQHNIHTAYTSQQKTNLLADFYKQLSTPAILLQEQHNTIIKQINQLSSAHNTDTILKDTKSDIYFPLVRWVQLQTIWGYIDDAVHYLEHNNYTSIDVHLGANVFVTAECPVLHLDIRHYYWMNDKRYPSSHGVSLDFDQYQKLKDVDRVLPDIVPDLKKTLPCQSTHQNVDSAIYCSECNPCCI